MTRFIVDGRSVVMITPSGKRLTICTYVDWANPEWLAKVIEREWNEQFNGKHVATDEMVKRALAWNVPTTASPDPCVLDRNAPRMGTNFFCYEEMRQLLEHALNG